MGMIVVGETVIDDDVLNASFCCDLEVCKGACCYLPGGRGAPLEDAEVEEIRRALPHIRAYLPERSLRTIRSTGMVEGQPGDYATVCVNERECAFAYFEDGIARCAFERAYNEGKIRWRKPLSCHLFPIRIRRFGREFMRYEEIDECRGGRERGARDQIRLYDFLRTPLARKYGDHWFQSFLDLAQRNGGSASC